VLSSPSSNLDVAKVKWSMVIVVGFDVNKQSK